MVGNASEGFSLSRDMFEYLLCISSGTGPRGDQGSAECSAWLLAHSIGAGCVRLLQGIRNPQDTSEGECVYMGAQ